MENLEQYFANEQADFFAYMIDHQLFKSRQTYRDYVSRLRYVARFFRLDKSLTKKGVDDILEQLRLSKEERDKYNTDKGITDIGSGLKRFLEYVESDYHKRLDDSILAEEKCILEDKTIPATERDAIVKSRIGQGRFRNKLINYWQGCAVTECLTTPLLLASHIRPWRKSDNEQRLDVYNGLLLTPNLDKLFDKGYISFDRKGRIIHSSALTEGDIKSLALSPDMHLIKIEDAHQQYLAYHREYCLL